MTMSSESRPEDGGSAGALAPVPELPEIDAFVQAKADEPDKARGFRARLLDYSAHAAMIVGLIGFTWTVGDHVIHRPALPDAPPAKVASAPTVDPLAELRERNRALGATVQTLQSRLDALQSSVNQHAEVSAQVHGFQAGLDGLKAGLSTARGEQTAAVARLEGKIDKLAHEPGSKIQQLVDRLGKLERSGVDVAPTASLPRPGEAEPRSADAGAAAAATVHSLPRPGDLKLDGRTDARADHKSVEPKAAEGGSVETRSSADANQGKPPVLASWVVRDVYRGVALIEGRRGTLEVVPGVSIPGAGVVKSIDRRGGGWTVTTTKGLMAAAAPARDSRRAERGYYGYNAPGYGYDF